MKKGLLTRQKIIHEAAPVFNRKGYSGTSMEDILQATGLQKGGIYRHFESKEQLAVAAFNYTFARIRRRVMVILERMTGAKTKLVSILDEICRMSEDPVLCGGCPLLNTGMECDDTNPVLKQRVQHALAQWETLLRRILSEGVAQGEIRRDVNQEAVIHLFIAAIEGAVFLSKVQDNTALLTEIFEPLKSYIQNQL